MEFLFYLCAIKLPKNNQKNHIGMIKKLETQSLQKALCNMAIGETCTAPEGYTVRSIRKTCSVLKKKGFLFSTTTKMGFPTITRLQ